MQVIDWYRSTQDNLNKVAAAVFLATVNTVRHRGVLLTSVGRSTRPKLVHHVIPPLLSPRRAIQAGAHRSAPG